ncbi:hypothetical protein [Phycicoccus jejuensis]|uniref:hypothetical protein n=1 Tax=Phycicoccus jejuensis TaxID=367299 RepID=UPI001B7FF1A5|nr:hypothetical protein [Phycicoccus jejuensis]
MTSSRRTWLLLPAGVGLLAGVSAGLARLGLPTPAGRGMIDAHGPLMVLGFLGTLVALERAVALRRSWALAAPVLLGAGGVTLALPLPRPWGQVLLFDGTVVLVAVLVALWSRRRDDTVAVETLAAVHAVMAALLWPRLGAAAVVPLLAGFVVLTIAAERVELAAVHLPRSAPRTLVLGAAATSACTSATLLWPDLGLRATGVVLLLLAVWLAPRDVAVRTVRSRGLPRFAAAAMLAGYAWLGAAGLLWVAVGPTSSAGPHDALVHAVFLGFATSMVMAHAPLILPAVLRRAVPYRPLFWLPLLTLHAALALRVAGDLLGSSPARVAGALGTAAALLALPLTAAASALVAAHALPSRREAAPAAEHDHPTRPPHSIRPERTPVP